MASASDIPGKFDVVINGQGYILANALPQRANYQYSPTFLPRTNVGAAFGDDQRAFWLTAVFRDWSLGEGRKNCQIADEQSCRSYYLSDGVRVEDEGEVGMNWQCASIAFGTSVSATCAAHSGSGSLFAASSTRLYSMSGAGATSDLGLHGLGANPDTNAMVGDSVRIYMSTTSGGTVGVRKYTSGAVFSTFSATAADALELHNNTLYGYRSATADLIRYDTAGVVTSLYSWLSGDGTADAIGRIFLLSYGGKLAILRPNPGYQAGIWLYDGTGVAQVASFPPGFYCNSGNMAQANGILFISGVIYKFNLTYPAIAYYANGTTGILWVGDAVSNVQVPRLAALNDRIVWTDDNATGGTGRLRQYDAARGAISTLATYTIDAATTDLCGTYNLLLRTRNSTTGYRYPEGSNVIDATNLKTAMVDFDSTLKKRFRGITVEWEPGNGNGGSVDIAYQVDTFSGSYTALQTAAVSGTEYLLSGVSGNRISVQVTLNRGTSNYGPKLKRIYVRAVPIQTSFKISSYLLDCAGRNGKSHVQLRNGTSHPLDGFSQVANLRAAAIVTTPFTISDRFGSFTGIIDSDDFIVTEIRPEEFQVKVTVREV